MPIPQPRKAFNQPRLVPMEVELDTGTSGEVTSRRKDPGASFGQRRRNNASGAGQPNGMVEGNMDAEISWVPKSQAPEERSSKNLKRLKNDRVFTLERGDERAARE